jgi:hypothetical protein
MIAQSEHSIVNCQNQADYTFRKAPQLIYNRHCRTGKYSVKLSYRYFIQKRSFRMPESFATKILRWGFNFFPAYRGTGGRITYIADDWREVRVKVPLSWRTRNYVGTIYGGSMYGAIDPVYMMMLIKTLGPEYVIWDKSASIQFKKPGIHALCAICILTDEEVHAITDGLIHSHSLERLYTVDLTDANGIVHASVEKTVYIRKRSR